MFFREWNEWKNPQFNFSSQYLSIERNFFKRDGNVTKISHLLFHRIWKIIFLFICSTYLAGCDLNHAGTYLKYYYHVRATYLHIENIHTIRYYTYFLGVFAGCKNHKGLTFWLWVCPRPQDCVHLRGHGKTQAQNHLVQGWKRIVWPSLSSCKYSIQTDITIEYT